MTKSAKLVYNFSMIKVKNSGIVELQQFDDTPDGVLVIAESRKNIPFEIRRVYWITNLGDCKAIRGKHAHKELEQVIFCVKGSFKLLLDDGETKEEIIMDKPGIGVRLGKLLWHDMAEFSKDCAIVVFANGYYKASDYIREYSEFLELVKQKINAK